MFKNTLLLVLAVAAGLGLAFLSQPQTPVASALATPPQPSEAVSSVPLPVAPAPLHSAPASSGLLAQALVTEPALEAPELSNQAQPATSESAHERLANLLQAGDSQVLEGFGQEAVAADDAALLAELEAALLAEFAGS
jgi:hypothetical protein